MSSIKLVSENLPFSIAMIYGPSFLQDSSTDHRAAGKTGPVCFLSADLPWPQDPDLFPHLLPGVHTAAATATTEGPGGGVSPVSQCRCCNRQWFQFPPHCVLYQWTGRSMWYLEKSSKWWNRLSKLCIFQSHKSNFFLPHLSFCVCCLCQSSQDK